MKNMFCLSAKLQSAHPAGELGEERSCIKGLKN